MSLVELATGGIIETRFGPFAADPRQVIVMVDPLPGFESCRRYVLVSSAEIEPFICLQGLEGPRPSFLAIDPRRVDPAFPAAATGDARRRLDASDDEPLLWLALVRVDEGREPSVNLCAPVVVSTTHMTGLQLVDAGTAYSIEHPLRTD